MKAISILEISIINSLHNIAYRNKAIFLHHPYVQKTVDIHPPKTGISVHFSDVFILMALQN